MAAALSVETWGLVKAQMQTTISWVPEVPLSKKCSVETHVQLVMGQWLCKCELMKTKILLPLRLCDHRC